MSNCNRIAEPISGKIFARLLNQERLVPDDIYYVIENENTILQYYALSCEKAVLLMGSQASVVGEYVIFEGEAGEPSGLTYASFTS